MTDKELRSILYDYSKEHTITELLQIVLDIIEYKEEHQKQTNE